MILIDNYDSFTYNLVRLFARFAIEILVFRNDQLAMDQIRNLRPDWICLSPGPKTPAHSGICPEVVRRLAPSVPILGVCLGMQVINEVFGGRTTTTTPVHGKTSWIHHCGGGILTGIPSPFCAARYHSLQVVVGSPCVTPLAWSDDGVIQALAHADYPVLGVQFHPESFLSTCGERVVRNFLATAERLQPEGDPQLDASATQAAHARRIPGTHDGGQG